MTRFVTEGEIEGLSITRNFLSEAEEELLLWAIGKADQQRSGPDRNRVERYGPGVVASGYSTGTLLAPQIPRHLAWLCDRVAAASLSPTPNAVTMNEYLRGQCLVLHTDMDKAGQRISTLGILGDADMMFQHGEDPPVIIKHPRRSLMTMVGQCRYAPWRHGVMPVEGDRISIVFRYARA